MKECPYCHASIEESARFCLYCMTPLEEKKTVTAAPLKTKAPLLIAIAVVLVVLLIGGGIWLFFGASPDTPSSEPDTVPTTTTATTTTTLADEHAATEANASTTNAFVTTTQGSTTTTTCSSLQTTVATGTDTYSYREATREDVYLALTIEMPDDVLVITGIVTRSADGIYRVPNVIDGKRVVSIAYGAFSGEDVRVVVLPDNVSTVNSGAFVDCPNLTDIYFVDSVYTYVQAFAPVEKRTGTLTIHCPQDCDNRYFYYYRNIASEWFDAEYREWNGGELT